MTPLVHRRRELLDNMGAALEAGPTAVEQNGGVS
jgi:hypothetical protein